jgi:peptidylprolyl isomerase
MYHGGMMNRLRTALPPLSAALLAATPLVAASPPARPLSSADIVAQAPAGAWAAIPAEDLLVIDFDTGQRVVIALAPAFAPVHVANIRTLARSGWFVGTTVNRVQDNYVTQWGDATEKKPLPDGMVTSPPAEYARALEGLGFRAMPFRDAYADKAGHAGGWPMASDSRLAWLPHCYGMVGVGRNITPDTGTGAELYTVIGHGPRHLDRNIAVVGRVMSGMEALSTLPRGTEALGVYKEGTPRPAIAAARLAADMPEAERPAFELMRSDSASFADWLTARANREDEFFIRPAGALDICNAMPPARDVRKP